MEQEGHETTTVDSGRMSLARSGPPMMQGKENIRLPGARDMIYQFGKALHCINLRIIGHSINLLNSDTVLWRWSIKGNVRENTFKV